MFANFIRSMVWPVVRAAAFTALGQGLLLWLAGQGVFIDLYVARMIGFIEASALAAPAWVGWFLAGALGIALSALWNPVGRLIRKDRTAATEFLKEDADDPIFITMTEAATRALESTEQTLVAKVARMPLPGGEDDTLGYYAYALLGSGKQQITIFGKTPPSRQRRRITKDEISGCDYSPEKNAFVDRYSKTSKFVEIELEEADVLRRIDEIKKWNG